MLKLGNNKMIYWAKELYVDIFLLSVQRNVIHSFVLIQAARPIEQQTEAMT